eukprot:m.32677 g.32677  ORF g.32677 m.32677 type:complete len:474 (+) comp9410_c0_seq2:180-1601(+)
MAETAQRRTPTTPTAPAMTTLVRSCSAEAAATNSATSMMSSLASALVRAVAAPLRALSTTQSSPPAVFTAGQLTTQEAPASLPAPIAVASPAPTVPVVEAVPAKPKPVELARLAAGDSEDVIVVVYRTTWSARMHASLDGQPWTPGLGLATAPCSVPHYTDCRMVAVPAATVRFVFNNGLEGEAGHWDNNQGCDYHIAGSGVYLLDCGVITRIDTAEAAHPVSALVLFTAMQYVTLTHTPLDPALAPARLATVTVDVSVMAASPLRELTDTVVVGLVPGGRGTLQLADGLTGAVDDASGANYALGPCGMFTHRGAGGTCGLCFLPMHAPRSVGTESSVEQWYKSALCNHQACAPCLRQWVASQVQQGLLAIRCPFPDCEFTLYAEDVREHATEADFARYEANCAQSFHDRMGEILADPDMAAYVESTSDACFCPKCGVLIERYEGCDAMVCTCNFSFCIVCKNEIDSCACNYY